MVGGPEDKLVVIGMDLGEDILDFIRFLGIVWGAFKLTFLQLVSVLPTLTVYQDCVGVGTFCPLCRLVTSFRCAPQLRGFTFTPQVPWPQLRSPVSVKGEAVYHIFTWEMLVHI
jgi:hypothetical protein